MKNSKKFEFYVSKIKFSDDTPISLSPGDIVLLVGPNNSGKSKAIQSIREMLTNPSSKSPVLKSVDFNISNESELLETWLAENADEIKRYLNNNNYFFLGVQIVDSSIKSKLDEIIRTRRLSEYANIFISILNSGSRLDLTIPPKRIEPRHASPAHPLQQLQLDDKKEKEFSNIFKKAFHQGIFVNREAGEIVPLHLGEKRIQLETEDYKDYVDYVYKHDRLDEQGDGMRSFAGILLHTLFKKYFLLLLDEPEAFLHPPQARIISRLLVSSNVSHKR